MAPFIVSTPPPVLSPLVTVQPAVTASADWNTYVVKSGDSLYTIAARHHTTVAALLARNTLPNGGRLIHPGQRILVPMSGSAPAATAGTNAASAKAPASTATQTYTVRSGDTLSGIASRHKTTARAIAGLNNISLTAHIHPGQKLRIPVSGSTAAKAAATSSAAPAPKPASTATQTYTVRSGDTLSGIASRHKTTARAIAGLNNISLTAHIQPGQKLRIPASGTSSSAAPQASTPSQPEMSVPFNSGGYSAKHFPSTTVAAAKKNHALLATMPVPSREQTRAMIVATANRHGVDPALALAIGYQESGWNQRQVSVANAIGVMQVIPTSGDWASGMVGRELNLLDAQDNITAGVVIIRALQRSTSDEATAIAGYYQGLASVRKNGMYRDTQAYVRSIQALRRTYQ